MSQLDPKVVTKLLDLLSSDDDFRKRFAESPEDALKEVGASDLSSARCLKVQALASKAQIQAARERLESQLTRSMDQQPLQLEASAHRE
jgi:putative modified peptide